MSEDYDGPRIGDLVHVKTGGIVVEMQAREGEAGVLVDLAGGGRTWVPLDQAAVVVRRTGS